MREGGYQLSDIFFQIIFSQIPVSISVVETDMDSCLEQIIFTDDGVEKWLHIDSAVLVPVEFQKSWCAEEVPKLEGELWGNSQEGIVVEALFVIVGWGKILSEELIELFQILFIQDFGCFVL